MACDNSANDVLHVPDAALSLPPRTHERGGEPAEKLRMGGPFALRAQIIERAGHPRAKELPPQTVDYHASGERIVERNEPVRQIETSRAAPAGVEFAQEGGDGGFNDFTRIV